MLLDPESYIPIEVTSRTELARQAYQAPAPRPMGPARAIRLFAALRLGQRPNALT